MGENQTVIVAIPAQDDYIWKLSSQKIPHLTLLYLGDTLSNAEDYISVVEFLEHASKMTINRFGLSVDTRGTLGPDDADVLFFRGDYVTKKLEDLRHTLKQHEAISTAYNSVEQFPDWIPHLTMGYPDDPAKEDERDYPGTHWVEFDRIALWSGDYDGPEFRLKDREDREEVAMNDLTNFLAHYGIRGMRWGVRRSDAQLSRTKSSPSKNVDDGDNSSDKTPGSTVKKANSGDDVFISADAERFIKTRQKAGHEMSDREIREALNRARMVKEYDELFGDSPNSALKTKVEQMRLQKEYSQLNAELNPSKIAKVKDLVKVAEGGWDAYKKLDDATNNSMTNYLSKEFGKAFELTAPKGSGKHRATT